jgi:ribosomal protein S18 acetylase RimI-like enzyme
MSASSHISNSAAIGSKGSDKPLTAMNQYLILEEIPQILSAKHLKYMQHTPTTAKIIHDTYGFFANGREMSHEVEQNLFDAFIEDDYDGHLHLMTLHYEDSVRIERDHDIDMSTSFCNDLGPPLGIVFWRDVPGEEMKDWIDWDHVTKALGRDSYIQKDSMFGKDAEGPKTLHLVRQSSIDSIRKMVQEIYLPPSSEGTTTVGTPNKDERLTRTMNKMNMVDNLTHAWIKLEFIAVRQRYWGRHLGSLLLSCALYTAHCKSDQSRVILHVAGGADNVSAVRLYERFGFHPVRQGTLFHKPDRFMYVLGDIARSLNGVKWEAGGLCNVEHKD